MTPRDYRREGALPRFSLDRRVSVLVLLLSTLVVGVVATLGIPFELIPKGYTAPFLQVFVPWTDAPPEEVQEKIVLPLEEELGTVRGIDRLISVSSHGAAATYVTFKQGTDMSVAYREVRDRLERARARFPSDVDHTYIRKHDTNSIPVWVLGVAVDPDVTDAYDLIQDEIVQPLSRVDGVANVRLDGLEEKEILIELDRERTAAAGLNIYELARELGSDNFSMASGTVLEGSRKLMLRSVARYGSIAALENRIVGPSVRLADVATVKYEEAEKDYRARAMSKPAVAVIVFKEGEANAVEVTRALGGVLERLRADPRLQGFQLLELFSQGGIIRESLRTLVNSGLIGGVIAGAVLFLFLRRFRMTLILSLSIPLSLLIGLTVMYFAGETLNLLTLLGLMLSVGLLVDNSVVVAENVHRLHRDGYSGREAAIHGAGEVALAITMSTLTTIVVFLPVALVQGPAQFFLMRMAIPVSVSLLGSLVLALVLIPLAMYLTLPERPAPERSLAAPRLHDRLTAALGRVYEGIFGRLSRAYGKMLAFFLSRRVDLVLAMLLVFGGTIALWVSSGQVRFVETQENEEDGFHIEVELAPQTTLEEAETWFREAEKVVEGKREDLGLEGWFLSHDEEDGRIEGWFTQPRTADVTAKEATKIVADALPLRPGMKIYTGQESDVDQDEERGTYVAALYGEDVRTLEETARRLEALLVRVDGVLGLKRGAEPPPNELGLVVDRARAQRFGVNPRVVAGVVGYALRGTPLPKFYTGGKEIPVRVRFRERDRESLAELANFAVPTASGDALPLSAVTDPHFLESRSRIVRMEKQSLRRITLELEEDHEEETRKRLDALLRDVDLPEGISFGANVTRIRLNDDLSGFRYAAILSVVFVYLLMAFLFESLVLPLSILVTIPLSFLGVFWIHFVTGRDLDFLGIVGIILLVGVVVNNGIVFVDYVHRLRAEGHRRGEALLLAADRRFRPIMMTAITTIGGMIPLAVAGAETRNGLSYTSFGLTLIGGMTTATLLTLLVVPVFYTFFDDARETVIAAVVRVLRRTPRPALSSSLPGE